MSDRKLIEDILSARMKKDELDEYTQRALKGDGFAQYILGDIYFYGIDTDYEYWKNVERTFALTQHSGRKEDTNFGFTCFCNRKPDYEEALKWFEMALRSGHTEAENKIGQILENKAAAKNKFLIQLFRYDRGNGCVVHEIA